MIEAEFIPKLRCRFVADDGRDLGDLGYMFADWLDTQPSAATMNIWRDSYLTKRQCREFWEYLGRTDRTPRRLHIYVNGDDVMRMWPAKK